MLGDVNTVGGNAAIINYAITDGLRPGNYNLGLNINRSSGMGLYLCRELCERYRAQLNYQRSERDGRSGNDFFLRLPVVQGETSA